VPLPARGGLFTPLHPVDHDATQGVSGYQAPDGFTDQLALMGRPFFRDLLLPVPDLTHGADTAEGSPSLLGGLLFLALPAQ
jgi:hypothetical protein